MWYKLDAECKQVSDKHFYRDAKNERKKEKYKRQHSDNKKV